MNELDNNELSDFLKNLSGVESDYGGNKNHPVLTKGVNVGQAAGGKYGIVPNSLIDFVNQSDNRGLPVPDEIRQLIKLPHEEITKQLTNNEDLDDAAGQVGARLVLGKAEGDQVKAAYGWNMGHNKDLANLDRNKIENNSYVKTFLQKAQSDGPRTFAEHREQAELNSPTPVESRYSQEPSTENSSGFGAPQTSVGSVGGGVGESASEISRPSPSVAPESQQVKQSALNRIKEEQDQRKNTFAIPEQETPSFQNNKVAYNNKMLESLKNLNRMKKITKL